jgi:hypothetical protein
MGIDSGVYKFVLVLHILCAIVGFGSVMLNGLYGNETKKRRGAEGLAISEANETVSHVGQIFIYGVFVFGILLVLLSDDVWSFGDTWIWLSMLLYICGIGLSHGGLLPRVRRLLALQRELVSMGPPPAGVAPSGPPPQVAEMEATGKQVAAIGATLNVIVVAVLFLMIWKPGT